jgi:hypothetical protein
MKGILLCLTKIRRKNFKGRKCQNLLKTHKGPEDEPQSSL